MGFSIYVDMLSKTNITKWEGKEDLNHVRQSLTWQATQKKTVSYKIRQTYTYHMTQ